MNLSLAVSGSSILSLVSEFNPPEEDASGIREIGKALTIISRSVKCDLSEAIRPVNLESVFFYSSESDDF